MEVRLSQNERMITTYLIPNEAVGMNTFEVGEISYVLLNCIYNYYNDSKLSGWYNDELGLHLLEYLNISDMKISDLSKYLHTMDMTDEEKTKYIELCNKKELINAANKGKSTYDKKYLDDSEKSDLRELELRYKTALAAEKIMDVFLSFLTYDSIIGQEFVVSSVNDALGIAMVKETAVENNRELNDKLKDCLQVEERGLGQEFSDTLNFIRYTLNEENRARKAEENKKIKDKRNGLVPKSNTERKKLCYSLYVRANDKEKGTITRNIFFQDGKMWEVKPRSFMLQQRLDYGLTGEKLQTFYMINSFAELVALDFFLFHTLQNKKGKMGLCLNCGKPFKQLRNDSYFCSIRCGSAYNNNFKKDNIKDGYDIKLRYIVKRAGELSNDYIANRPTKKLDADTIKSLKKQWQKDAKDILSDIRSKRASEDKTLSKETLSKLDIKDKKSAEASAAYYGPEEFALAMSDYFEMLMTDNGYGIGSLRTEDKTKRKKK